MFSANSSQVSEDRLYVEDVFSTWLYTGNGSAQTITNGIDLAGKGGMVWIKSRSAATDNFLFDTSRGVNVEINSNTTNANATLANSLTAFNSNGFSISSAAGIGVNAATYASWTFREAPKFFDVVTYTGNGTTQSISHNLGVAPGVIIVKQTSTTTDWVVYHRSLGETYRSFLNATNAATNSSSQNAWGDNTTAVAPTSTNFTVGNFGVVNASGGTYVAYLFAHDATSDGIIQCGSYTGNGYAGAVPNTVTLGWEPQWVMVKKSSSGVAPSDWFMFDNMRGMPVASAQTQFLSANTSGSEIADTTTIQPTSTGFQLVRNYSGTNANGETYIYIAIRRGPMRTPTLGTSVFAPALGNSSGAGFTSGFPVDAAFIAARSITEHKFLSSRLTGTGLMDTDQSIAEYTDANNKWDYNTQYYGSALGSSWVSQMFRRAPSFMDVVCYTGTGANLTVSHNLGVVPELMIVKSRSAVSDWQVYSANLANTEYLVLNTTAAKATGTSRWNSTTPSSTTFTVGTAAAVNTNAATYVAYLFASCPGVSKVGSYTGNGSSQTINCGFAAGARFVMIKRTNSTGDWYVWDTARGIVSGNDPHLSLNTTTAEVTSNDTIDTDSSGFVVNQVAATNINVSSATYIYLAVA